MTRASTWRSGQCVTDPETGIEYTYRPDLNPDAPFYSGGEFYTLNGVSEVES